MNIFLISPSTSSTIQLSEEESAHCVRVLRHKQGDEITVQGSQAKDGSFLANARSVVLATGKKVFAGSSQEQGN